MLTFIPPIRIRECASFPTYFIMPYSRAEKIMEMLRQSGQLPLKPTIRDSHENLQTDNEQTWAVLQPSSSVNSSSIMQPGCSSNITDVMTQNNVSTTYASTDDYLLNSPVIGSHLGTVEEPECPTGITLISQPIAHESSFSTDNTDEDWLPISEIESDSEDFDLPENPSCTINVHSPPERPPCTSAEVRLSSPTALPKRSRWNKPNPFLWKKNLEKQRRKERKPYKSTKGKDQPAKHPKPINCSSCRFKCSERISAALREAICCEYWSLDFARQKDFILRNVATTLPQQRRPRKDVRSRTQSRLYSFETQTENVRVCQNFFCKTLCISNGPINTALKERGSGGQYAGKDNRGQGAPKNKTSEADVADVKAHIESFPIMESHYTRKSSKRLYLDCNLNITKMYELYQEKYINQKKKPVSEISYRRILCNNYNISFFRPKKDQCSTCNRYKQATPEEEHCIRKDAAMEAKSIDKKRSIQESFMSISCDLQSVLQIPSSKVSLLYYLRKLNVYNFTVYEAAPPNNGYCYFWSEINGKRGSCEVGSCLLFFIENSVPLTVKHLTIFSDTCGGQNRNIQLWALLLYAVRSHPSLQVIEQKYMESGHSYMEVDSMHSCIETAKKDVDVLSIHEWENIFRSARGKNKNKFITKEMLYPDFLDLKKLVQMMIGNKKVDTEGNSVNWLKVKCFQYKKCDPNFVGYKYNFADDYRVVDVSMKTSRRRNYPDLQSNCHNIPKLYTKQLPISLAKKKYLIHLCEKNVITQQHHERYYNLPVTKQAKDRVPEPAISDTSEDDSSEY